MFEDANAELEEIDPFNRANPEVLRVRAAIYHGLGASGQDAAFEFPRLRQRDHFPPAHASKTNSELRLVVPLVKVKAMNLRLMRANDTALKASTSVRLLHINKADYVIRRFNAFPAGLKIPWSWTFAGTPLNAISISNWSSDSAEMRR
ncbi:MAG: hypothetical protein QOH88_3440 [Verrucomicrobiota bacterium]